MVCNTQYIGIRFVWRLRSRKFGTHPVLNISDYFTGHVPKTSTRQKERICLIKRVGVNVK